jgi:hypothetical protein
MSAHRRNTNHPHQVWQIIFIPDMSGIISKLHEIVSSVRKTSVGLCTKTVEYVWLNILYKPKPARISWFFFKQKAVVVVTEWTPRRH